MGRLRLLVEGGKLFMRVPKDLGILLLAIWLILYGLTTLFPVGIAGVGTILAVLALAAGIVLLVRR